MRARDLRLTCSLLLSLVVGAPLVGCGDAPGGGDGGPPDGGCPVHYTFTPGTDGHSDPLGVQPGEARAGRITAGELPVSLSGMAVWEAGDFVLANERVALIIEDVGPSDLYDPWGGRPVGMARVEGGALVDAADFGELFVLTSRTTVLTDSVSVIDDGSSGGAAIVRASGPLKPLPFYDAITNFLFPYVYAGVDAAIDYVLEPGADYVDIYVTYHTDAVPFSSQVTGFAGFMYTDRMPLWVPGYGFGFNFGGIGGNGSTIPYAAFVDDRGVSWAMQFPDGDLSPVVDESGFKGMLLPNYSLPGCAETKRHHARVTIGGLGIDGLGSAMRRTDGVAERTITGVVYESGGAPAEGARVHALSTTDAYLTRSAVTDATGAYSLHVDADQDVKLVAWRKGEGSSAEVPVPAASTAADLFLPDGGWLEVQVTDVDTASPLPVRVQVLPVSGSAPQPPASFGEYYEAFGRIHVAFPKDGHVLVPVPAGDVRVVASRGYEYDLASADVNVPAGTPKASPVTVGLSVQRVVDTSGVMCGDFHIHTHRSNDSADLGTLKVLSAIGDGLEIPVRSDHEFVNGFDDIVQSLGLTPWAFGMSSVELTTMELYGHMGVVPANYDPLAVNGGTPLWQRYPTAADETIALENLLPPDLFDQVRARPEQPALIINHPRGGKNYFTQAEYDPVTGTVGRPEMWDELFDLVEVFNGSGWDHNRDGTVVDWLSFLDSGRRVFAVGSSDSHGVRATPVGYPRTCLRFPAAVDPMTGEDDPRLLTPNMVRDQLRAGHSVISGGIYLTVDVNGVGPGDEATGVGSTASLNVRVQAAPWVDVTDLVIVVDGAELGPAIAIPSATWPGTGDGITRLATAGSPGGPIPIPVSAAGSYVIVAARGAMDLDIHPGKLPFAVSNPIFLSR